MSTRYVAPRTRLATAGARSAVEARIGRRPPGERVRGSLFYAFLLLMISLSMAGLAALIIDAFIEGQPRLGLTLFTEPTAAFPEDSGFLNAIVGTLYVIGGVIALVVPLGVGAAIYLEEYADRERWWNRLIELNIQNLAAVPSIVYGILGLAFIVRGPLSLGFVVLAGSITLALLVLPTVILASREAIRAVPVSIRQASLALGTTQWQTIRGQVLPAAVPGIATGVILAVGRAIGETAPLLLVGAATFVTFVPGGYLDRYTVLPVQIFSYFSRAQEEYIVLAAAGIIVMLILLLAMNSFAIWLRNRYEQRW
ncbi:phosphate ABC transporter permease PstA [Mycolicibacterium iranicum]|uniref:Phosphate transport system permease protein PstA n=1 Tax=Mycolicibacterium iranicum TaxID=912594 RepID=A0A178LNW4_MYCIR|nr:phosphate ABC transporter permease PstA [Mycolicibacterium iranicum]OAN33575.1 phosphate ABC transporter, permease protein PstA [Mycolicibacterium iranicum]